MNKRNFLATIGLAAAMAACSTTNPNVSGDAGSKRAAIDANVSGALSKLYAQEPSARELTRKARGVLVFPAVVSAGFVVGGSYGQGALLVGNQTAGYYSTTAASVGLLAGADSKAVYVLFMTQEALDKFRASKGWTAGADASVSVLKAGANAGVDTQTVQQPVIGYVLTNAGLMANLSIDGTKVNKLDL
ncbi:MAG: YSC84-related protein [Pseudomonadota bacterium]|nr:YSC84-related protein [Pseudomonadota bacterium]